MYSLMDHMINYFRCYRDERLLLTTDKTAIEISHMVGFSNPKYFYSNFRKWWDIRVSVSIFLSFLQRKRKNQRKYNPASHLNQDKNPILANNKSPHHGDLLFPMFQIRNHCFHVCSHLFSRPLFSRHMLDAEIYQFLFA